MQDEIVNIKYNYSIFFFTSSYIRNYNQYYSDGKQEIIQQPYLNHSIGKRKETTKWISKNRLQKQ